MTVKGEDVDQKRQTVKELEEKDIIEKCTGSFGPWQLVIVMYIFLIKLPVAFHQIDIVVLTPNVDFLCENQTIAACSSSCSKHVFDKLVFSNTVTMQWDLVCDKEYLESIVQTLSMFGILTGSGIFGFLSDRYGRKMPMVGAVALQFLAGVATALVPWFYVFLLLRFLTSFATGGTIVVGFVMVMEVIGVKWRTKFGILYQLAFDTGHLLIPVISYFLRDWRYFQLAISIPSVLFISYYWIVPESPRWLLAVGRSDEAVAIMKKASRLNRIHNDKIEQDVKEYMAINQNNNAVEGTGNILDLFRTPTIRKYTIVMWLNWLFVGLSFFGANQYIGQIGGNIFLNIALAALAQMPGVVICCWIVEIWGRRNTVMLGNLLGGIFLIMTDFVPDEPFWIKPILPAIGISCIMISFATIFVYAGELYPTFVRNVGLGSCSTCARVGSMVAPFIDHLSSSDGKWVPTTIFGLSMLIGAVLCYLLPETMNCKLPETLEDVEEFERKRRKSHKKNLVVDG